MGQMSLRTQVEKALVRRFPDQLRPIDDAVRPMLRRFRNGQFGLSYSSFLLYCTGRTPWARSTQYPRGLAYVSGQTAFGVGCFVAEAQSRGGVHFVAPAGPAAIDATTEVAAFLRSQWPEVRVYARHLCSDACRAFRATGVWTTVEGNGWHRLAPQEDETYNHRVVNLGDILDLDRPGNPVVPLSGLESRQFRCKARRAFARFSNFLARNEARYDLIPHTSVLVPEVHEFIGRHFIEIEENGQKPIGSSAEDYLNLVEQVPDAGDPDMCFRVGILSGPGFREVVSFFAAESISQDGMGCYAMLTRRSLGLLPERWDTVGFSAVSQFSLLSFLAMLAHEGIKSVDVGGSETAELDRFKRQLGATEEPSHWLMYRP